MSLIQQITMPMGDSVVLWRWISSVYDNVDYATVSDNGDNMYLIRTDNTWVNSTTVYNIKFFSSFDRGQTWSMQTWLIDKKLNNRVRCNWNGDWVAVLLSPGNNSILRISLDRGLTWRDYTDSGTTNESIHSYFTNYNFSTIYLGCKKHIYRSIDLSNTYQRISPVSEGFGYYDVAGSDSGDVVYGIDVTNISDYTGKLIRSMDAGKTWTTIPGVFRDFTINSTGEIILAITRPSGWAVLSISYDYGATWREIYRVFMSGGGGTIIRGVANAIMSDDGRVIIFCKTSNDGSTSGTFRSNDYGYSYNYEPDIGAFTGYVPQRLIGNKNLNGMIAYNPTAISGAPSRTWVYYEP